MTTVLISDDHQLVRDALSRIINWDKRFRVIGTSGDSAETVEMCKDLQPDILLMDINMRPFNGIEATRQIRRISPKTGIIAVTLHNEPAYAIKIFEAGARGYVTKNSPAEEMFEAILSVVAGKKFVCREMRKIFKSSKKKSVQLNAIHSLTERELELIEMIRKGCSSKDISKKLAISVKTVEVHRHNIIKKLGVKNSLSVIEFMNASAIHL